MRFCVCFIASFADTIYIERLKFSFFTRLHEQKMNRITVFNERKSKKTTIPSVKTRRILQMRQIYSIMSNSMPPTAWIHTVTISM